MNGDKAQQDKLGEILEELKSQKSKKKDLWDLLGPISTFLSAVVLGGIGLIITSDFNERQSLIDQKNKEYQTRILEMQTVERFIPYLTSEDENKQKVALLTITSLGSPEFATMFAKLNPTKGTQAAVDRIMASAPSTDQNEIPQSITSKPAPSGTTTNALSTEKKTGWVYLGHYVETEDRWETRYFDFRADRNPSELVTTVLPVSKQTGTINVRADMPSLTGQFGRVLDVLKPPSQVKVISVKEWYSTGYMWAQVTYEI